MDELPIEHPDETMRPDDDVADAEVAVIHDDRPRRRRVLAQPPETELDRGMRLVHLVHLPRLLRRAAGKEHRLRDVDLAAEQVGQAFPECLSHSLRSLLEMETAVIPDLIAERRVSVRSFMEEFVYPNEQALFAEDER